MDKMERTRELEQVQFRITELLDREPVSTMSRTARADLQVAVAELELMLAKERLARAALNAPTVGRDTDNILRSAINTALTPRWNAAYNLVTGDVIEAAMQALFTTGGRLIGATSGDWPPDADEASRRAIKEWLIQYAYYNVPTIQHLSDE